MQDWQNLYKIDKRSTKFMQDRNKWNFETKSAWLTNRCKFDTKDLKKGKIDTNGVRFTQNVQDLQTE